MGWARIIDGGPTGRYNIELDWGESTRTAVLAALGVRVAELDAKLAIAEAKVITADAQEATLRAAVTAQMDAYIAASIALPPGSPRPDSSAFRSAMALLTKVRQGHAGLRLTVEKLKFERAVALDRVSYWTNFNSIESRPAWCSSLTEDAAPGSVVATLDIKGESDLIVIAPEARAWQPSDGVLTAREMMSPEQAFWNAAALPGWQKWQPTYRWGTVDSINFAEDTMNLTLGEAKSSAQRLDINRETVLFDVPVIYGSCNSRAFRIDDRVVVQFVNQNWSAPLVIGFLDNPRGCGWVCIGAEPFGAFDYGKIYFATRDQSKIDALLSAPADAWTGMTSNGPAGFEPLQDDFWPGYSTGYDHTGSGTVSIDTLNETVTIEKTHAKNIAAGTDDVVGITGIARRAADSGLSLPSGWVGVVELTVTGFRLDAPSFIGDIPDEWFEVLVKDGANVIFNVVAKVSSAVGISTTMRVDTLGGLVPLVTGYPVELFAHTLYSETT